jgi:predicted dehydrogenase
MVAIGGYGYHYLRTLLDEVPADRAILAGVVDPFARDSPAWSTVESLGVPVCETVDGFYDAGHQADLAVVVSPIHMHVPQSIAALGRGSSVLCDKPIAATIQETRALAAARDRAGRFVLVGYQWSFSAAIQALKRDLLAGVFGRPRRLVTLCCWPRPLAYYRRNTWAGRLRDADTGAWVLDSPANNAMAHFLHNACFLLGPTAHLSARPSDVCAELYRANPIDSADTAACRIILDGGCEVLFLASHATDQAIAPRFRLECDHGVVTFGEDDRIITATLRSGAVRHYGDPDGTPQFTKLHTAIAQVRDSIALRRDSGGQVLEPRAQALDPGDPVRDPDGPTCGIEAAAAQTLCVNAMHDSVPDIVPFPEGLVMMRDGDRLSVPGLDGALLRCYERWSLPSEMGVPWARAGRTIDVTHYSDFPGGSAASAGSSDPADTRRAPSPQGGSRSTGR